ncbi:MAG: efflux RND transporter permease subunit, partial [Desulfobacterales bacterium]|nr:efflux RND transporter permease subunit [Desulfobacterales bacterium]
MLDVGRSSFKKNDHHPITHMKLVNLSIKYPVSVIVGVFFLILFGILSLLAIPVQLTPDVTRPKITVTTRWSGASPLEIEREIIDEQEEYLKGVEGLTRLTSESMDSRGRVILEFEVGTDIDAALLKVSTKLDQVPSYPEDADRPIIISAGENASAIAWMVMHRISKDAPPLFTLRNFAEDYIEPRLSRVPGIAKVNVYGGREEEMQVIFDEMTVAARDLSIAEIARALSEGNKNISAGNFDDGKRRYIARTEAEYLSPEEAEDVVIKYVGGFPVTIKDVAVTKYGYKKKDVVTRIKGHDTVVLNAIRQSGFNELKVMAGLKKAIADLNENLLADLGVRLEQTYDETSYIDSAINLVRQNLFVGGSLAVIVLLIFLRSISSTLIVALAIPISIIGSFLMLLLFGRTINVISLAGCAFAAGMVVDNSIVVLENIYRHREMGESKASAALVGAGEVWGAVLASTLTTVAVFLPIIFVQEEAGQLFRDIAIAISFAVLLSLLVSITVIPSLASRIIGTTKANDDNSKNGKTGLNQLFGLTHLAGDFRNKVTSFVYWLCGRTWGRLIAVSALTGLALSMALFLAPKAEYLPQGNRNMILGIMIPPPGYSVDEFESLGEFIEGRLEKYFETDPDDSFEGPSLSNFFYVAYGQMVFMGLITRDPLRA